MPFIYAKECRANLIGLDGWEKKGKTRKTSPVVNKLVKDRCLNEGHWRSQTNKIKPGKENVNPTAFHDDRSGICSMGLYHYGLYCIDNFIVGIASWLTDLMTSVKIGQTWPDRACQTRSLDRCPIWQGGRWLLASSQSIGKSRVWTAYPVSLPRQNPAIATTTTTAAIHELVGENVDTA